MENLRKTFYRIRYFIGVFIFLGLSGVGELQAQCDDLDVTITRIQGSPNICEDVVYRVKFMNNGSSYISGGDFVISIDDPSGNGYATIDDVDALQGALLGNFSGHGTGTIDAYSLGFDPGADYHELEITVGFSCDMWDDLGSLSDYEINVLGFSPNNTCFDVSTEPFDVGYVTVEPNPLTPPDITVDLGETFTETIDLLVNKEGFGCDRDFILFSDFDDCIDLSEVVIVVSTNDFCQWQTPFFVPASNFTITGNQIELTVNVPDCVFPPSPAKPCLGPGNYAGAYGDFVIEFRNLRKTCCGDGGGSDIVHSTTTCDADSPASCSTGGQLESQFTSGIQTVWTPNGGLPALTITPTSNTGIKICDDNDPFTMQFEVCNNSSDDAYDIGFNFNNWYGLNVTNASITDNNGNETFLLLSGTDPNIGLGNIGVIDDANLDMLNNELVVGHCFTFWVELTYPQEISCLFDDYSCPANFHKRPYTFNLTYNNQCSTLSPEVSTSSNAQFNDLSASTSYIDPQVGNLPEILQQNTQYNLGLCMGPIDQSGWNGISDHGELNQCVTITSNYPNVTYTTLTGDFGTVNASGGNNFILPPGVTFDSDCGLIGFSFSCVDAPSDPIHFDVTVKAFWDDCPDCGLELACPEIDLFTVCPGGNGVDTSGCPIDLASSDIVNFTVEGLTTTQGEHRAYPCDEVRMTTIGTMNESFSGVVSGCYFYQDGTPAVFTDGGARLFVNNQPVASANFSGSGVNDGLEVFRYSFGNQQLNDGDLVQVVISVNVESDPLSGSYWQNLDLFATGIGFGEQMCKITNDFTVLDYDISLIETQGGNCCSALSRDYRIEYTGGGFGDDFPGMTRVLGQFNNAFMASVDQGNILSVVDQTPVVNNGVLPLLLPAASTSWNASQLANPRDKTAFNGVIHRFRVNYEPACGGGVGMDLTGTWESGVYAGTNSDCFESHPINDMNTHNIVEPVVNTTIIGGDIVVHENTAIINTNTWVTQADACNPFIQLEYDPSQITITYNGPGTPIQSGNGNTAIFAVEYPSMGNGDPSILDQFTVTFTDACDGPLEINLFGSHYCFGGEILPDVFGADLDCPDSDDSATISILPSDVNLAGYDCDSEATECEIHYFSFILDNQEDGNSYNVGLLADLPPGFTVEEAYYDYPYSSSLNNCNTTGTPVPTNELGLFTSTGWLIKTNWTGEGDGFLPGESHQNSTAAQRTFHIVLGIIGSCDVDADDLLASFEAVGNLNCGDEIDIPPFEAELNLGSAPFVIPEVEITVDSYIKCVDGSGNITFNVDFLDDNLDIDPNQTFKLSLSGGVGYNLTCLSPIQFPYGDASFTCNVELTSSACDYRSYKGNYILSTCYEKVCGPETCEIETEILLDEPFYFHPGYQQVYINDISFDEEFCDEDSQVNSKITITINSFNVDPGTNTEFQLWCDVNGNCVQDQGDFFLQGLGVQIVGGQQVFSFGMTPAEFHSLCGDGQVVVTMSWTNNHCLCVRDACETLCCPCPEWDISVASYEEDQICFDIVEAGGGDMVPDCVEFYLDGVFHGTDVISPYCQDIPEGTEEICIVIHSDQTSGDGCDEAKTIITIDNQEESKKWCMGECQEEYCLDLNDCNLEVAFGAGYDVVGSNAYEIFANASILVNVGGTNPQYFWTLDGAPIANTASWSDGTYPEGEYKICLTVVTTLPNGKECKDEFCSILTIDVEGLKTCENFLANFDYDVSENGVVVFKDASRGPGKVGKYSWEIDGKQVTSQGGFFQRLAPGLYRVKMTITYYVGDLECTKSISKWVKIPGTTDKDDKDEKDEETGKRSDVSDVYIESSVFPNPHLGKTNIQINSDSEKELVLNLYGLYGNVVWTEHVTVKEGTLNKALDMEGYAPGIYVLVINGDNFYKTHKVILTR